MSRSIYVIGSLRNPAISEVVDFLRAETIYKVNDDWRASPRNADDNWRDYEKNRGRTYIEALYSPFAVGIVEVDRKLLVAAEIVILVLPSGPSAHIEIGLAEGLGKVTLVYRPANVEFERWEVMHGLLDSVVESLGELLEKVKEREARDPSWRKPSKYQ